MDILWITAVLGVYNHEYVGIRMHARYATLCPGIRGISKHQNIKTPGSSSKTAGQNMGL